MNQQSENAAYELDDENSIHQKYLSYIMDEIFMRTDYPRLFESYGRSGRRKPVRNLSGRAKRP
jgi:hypothetical protein